MLLSSLFNGFLGHLIDYEINKAGSGCKLLLLFTPFLLLNSAGLINAKVIVDVLNGQLFIILLHGFHKLLVNT